MSQPAAIDPDLLRSFSFIAEEGSFTRAAERVGRTQSAVSMQMQRLEALLGQQLILRSKGGSVQLTAHGRFLLERARSLLAAQDEIWTTFHAPGPQGTVRIGSPDDYALIYLPQVLKRFADSNPSIDVEVICLPSDELVERMQAGALDLTLVSEFHEPPGWPLVELWRGPLRWITSERHAQHRLSPLPLALAHRGCSWRAAALSALDATGVGYRTAYTSTSQTGSFAPVLAGLAVTVSNATQLPDGLRAVRPDEGLPPLPALGIFLLKSRTPGQPATEALANHIIDAFRLDPARPNRAIAA
jgi:DNA-binding transcriptional LysR family regulator